MDIVAFQGLGQRNWPALYRVPEIQEAIHWGQGVVSAHNIQVEGKPLNLIKACQDGELPLEHHSPTCWQQPCIFLASMAYWKMWREQNPKVKKLTLLGFSFGEWTAATAAGCLHEEIGLLAVTMRGIFTSQAGGSSLLINARDRLPIKRLWFHCKRTEGVWLANINSPVQGLVSGETSKLYEIQQLLTEHYPWLVIRPLDVGGAFHTPFMKRARKQLAAWMEQEGIRFREPQLPLILNATHEMISEDPQRIQQMLLRQISARLNFKKLAENLTQDCTLHELCLGRPIIGPLIQQTWNLQKGPYAVPLVTLPFPA